MINTNDEFIAHKFKLPVTILQCLLLLIPPVIFFIFIQKYALNLPKMDDYDAILNFLNNYNTSNSFSEKARLLFSQHNEHRILLPRLIFLLDLKINGAINFKQIIFINFSLIFILYLLLIHFGKKVLPGKKLLVASLASLCLFSVNSYDNCNFAMAGAQNYGVIMLFLSSMYFYGKFNNWLLPFAILFQILCVFTSGNGNVASFFLVSFVLLSKYKPSIIACVTTFIIIAPLYYYNYASPGNGLFTTDPTLFLPYFARVLGAHWGFKLSLYGGMAAFLAFLWLIPHSAKWRENKNIAYLVCIGAFVLASTMVLAVFRGSLPPDSAYTSRYLIYSDMIVFLLTILLLYKFSESRYFIHLSTAVVIALVAFYYRGFKEGREGYQLIHERVSKSYYEYPDGVKAQSITNKSCELKIYCIDNERYKHNK